MKFLGGESGVPLKLQFDIQDTKLPSLVPLYSAGCQIKVFRVGCQLLVDVSFKILSGFNYVVL